ncbi:hypothetical protein AVEN_86425-1 [Araneus ventricosus]|uniref:Tc1-like transposase DDE domain-containing protein n=1 Tax=Araneus ventricosus TaxID=182803 RepID=A0A4Y2IEZ4_ARAVE|nr:hypothetical protein AVEN_86425-1 [Araneus ventricosus]
MEETILDIVDETLHTRTKAIALCVHVSQLTVWRDLNEERLHPFHIQRGQVLQETENPHATRPHAFQKRFSVNVWAGIVNDILIFPYLPPTRLNGSHYLIFLEKVLPELLQDIPTVVRNKMWLQHDGAPAHFKVVVRNYMDANFAGDWRGGPI